ncbi:haloacid dehalogenase [Cubamyces menziesii]|nr:haloacid dehalogenase [Cubamyces menziesii]
MTASEPLRGVEAYVFDIFGTVVDWYGSVSEALADFAGPGSEEDWGSFVKEWRDGYKEYTARVAKGGQGSTNADTMHREARTLAAHAILDSMLESSRWKHLAPRWDDTKREEMVLFWHKLNGWPDSSRGLHRMKEKAIIGTLSNGNVRLLIDMAKFADLPWDVVFSGELLGSYKPNPQVYLRAIQHLSVPPDRCAMVAAHIYDLRAAASHGMKTVYVRRPTEDLGVQDMVKCKEEGGEVDIVVNSLEELAALL